MCQLVHGNSCYHGCHSPKRTNPPLNIAMVFPLGSYLARWCCCCCWWWCWYSAFVTIKTIHINMTHHKICSPSATFHLPRTIAWITGQSFVHSLLCLASSQRQSGRTSEWNGPRVKISMDHSVPKEQIREAHNDENDREKGREKEPQQAEHHCYTGNTINDFRAHHLYTTRHSVDFCMKFNLFVFATATRIS